MTGVDLGGTKIEVVVLSPTGETLLRRRRPTEQERGYEAIVANVAALVREAGPLPARIGIGTPGTTDPSTGLLVNSNTQCLNGRPFVADLAAALGIEVRAANDANCFALAEATLGAARGYETVFGVILGTGVGGGLVVDGRVLNGAHGIAGEWGHNPLDPGGHLAYSGRRGVVESVISGPALERFYFECTGTRRPLPEIVAREGADLAAAATVRRLTEEAGRALGGVVNLFDPHAIVLGGGVGNVPGLVERLPAEITKHTFHPGGFRAAVLRPTLGDSAGVFGAAMLVR